MNQFITFLSTTVEFVIHTVVIAFASVVNFITLAWEPTKAYAIYAYHQGIIFYQFVSVHIATLIQTKPVLLFLWA